MLDLMEVTYNFKLYFLGQIKLKVFLRNVYEKDFKSIIGKIFEQKSKNRL